MPLQAGRCLEVETGPGNLVAFLYQRPKFLHISTSTNTIEKMGEPIAIVGAGITGLATAYLLSDTHPITIIARDLPGDINTQWASPWYMQYYLTHISLENARF